MTSFMRFTHAKGPSYRLDTEVIERVASTIELLTNTGRVIVAVTTIADSEIVVWYQTKKEIQ